MEQHSIARIDVVVMILRFVEKLLENERRKGIRRDEAYSITR